jgi:hypothetical protein
MSREISNHDDVIDSRDVIERIEELTDEREYILDKADMHDAIDLQHDTALELDEWDADNASELAALKALAEDAEGYVDWKHGAQLIRDDYFEDHAREMAEDMGAVKDDASWPYTCIDWEQAARELQQDYTSVEFDGVTYWVR